MTLKALLVDIDNTVYAYAPCHAAGLEAARALAGSRHAAWRSNEAFLAAYHLARREVKGVSDC